MRKNKYRISFKNSNVHSVIKRGMSKEEAKILAQAETIKKGLDYRVEKVVKLDYVPPQTLVN